MHIWDSWELEDGTTGRGHSAQWKPWPTPNGGFLDQIAQVVASIRSTSAPRRHGDRVDPRGADGGGAAAVRRPVPVQRRA